jgi:opacity protein-like surface antigen
MMVGDPYLPNEECIMLRKIAMAALVLLGSTAPVWADAKDDVQAAAAKLADSGSYSWTTTMESGQFSSNSSGKTQKDGFTSLSLTLGDNTTLVVLKGNKSVIKTDDGWKTAEEVAQQQQDGQPNPMRFVARMVQTYKSPAEQASDYAGKAPDLQKTDDGFSGNLSEEAAKDLMTFRRRNAAASTQPAAVKNAKGSVKFWIKDGVLSKMQYEVSGTVTFNDQDRDIDRTTTIQITDVGSTQPDVPDEAKAKLQ